MVLSYAERPSNDACVNATVVDPRIRGIAYTGNTTDAIYNIDDYYDLPDLRKGLWYNFQNLNYNDSILLHYTMCKTDGHISTELVCLILTGRNCNQSYIVSKYSTIYRCGMNYDRFSSDFPNQKHWMFFYISNYSDHQGSPIDYVNGTFNVTFSISVPLPPIDDPSGSTLSNQLLSGSSSSFVVISVMMLLILDFSLL